MIRGKYLILLASALVLSLNSGCSQRQAKSAEAVSPYPRQSVELIAPAGVRSGSDLTLRSVAQCLRDAGLVDVPLPVTNRPGNGGGLALDYLNEHIGADDALAVFSPPVCLIHLNGSTPLSYHENTTPIAKLVTDYGCFAVASNSPYQNLNQVMEALREDPGSVRVGGTSSVGSMDHVQFLKVAQAAGIEALDQLSYTGFEDGRVLAQLLGGHVDIVSAGIGDVVGLVESGDVRVLGITAEQIQEDVHVLGKLHPQESAEQTMNYLTELAVNEQREWDFEYIHQKTGEHRWFHVIAMGSNVEGRTKYILVMSDRTADKKINQALSEAVRAAETANRAKSTFLSNMSHDIRTPMNAIHQKNADRRIFFPGFI